MLNASIRDIPVPRRMAGRPINERGFPVPWFVSRIKGQWDFVNLDPRKIIEAYQRKICFLCGEPLGQYKAFVIGPMCCINRISSECPAHLECAEYAVRVCPFLARPSARRNDKAAVNHGETVPGIMIQHNPGANLIWITKHFEPISDGRGGILFALGEPTELRWYAEGRKATRAEIDAAINKGLPYLYDAARRHDGPDGVIELEKKIGIAMKLLPVETDHAHAENLGEPTPGTGQQHSQHVDGVRSPE